MIFAAAPSQNELLAGLLHAEDIDWSRIHAFHMDEYVGLPDEAAQRFGIFLRDRLFGKLPIRQGPNTWRLAQKWTLTRSPRKSNVIRRLSARRLST